MKEPNWDEAPEVGRRNDGGPAFPEDWNGQQVSGMSMRDYFAAKAMPALLLEMHQTGMAPIKGIAAVAYEVADAMLAERDKAGAQ